MKFLLSTALAGVLSVSAFSADALTFTLNTNGGDGGGTQFLDTGSFYGLTMTSNDNGFGGLETVFSVIADTSGTFNFGWFYSTTDTDGSRFDPFGFSVNGSFTQLTLDDLFGSQSGTASVDVALGDTFSFVLSATEGLEGPAGAAILGGFSPAAVPLPASGLMLGAALVGVAARRRLTSQV